ncbi:MAG: hypothetical protein AB1640_25080 [bacterium]
MKTLKISRMTVDELRQNSFDAIVVASGYESRARAFAQGLKGVARRGGSIKCAWGFEEYIDNPVRRKNDCALTRMGYKISVISGSDGDPPEKWISNLLSENEDRPLSLAVDISSMTRTWYGGIVKALSRTRRRFPVRSVFAYIPALWSGRQVPAPPNEVVGPVSGYASHALPNKPTALVVGLGGDHGRALGLNDYLDPETTACFFSDPGADRRYTRDVLGANRDLIASIRNEYLYQYDLFDAFGTYKTLESVCQGLSREYRVVLASLGPKIFGLYCFLIHTNFPEVSVWRVSPATRLQPVDHKPAKQAILLDVSWA